MQDEGCARINRSFAGTRATRGLGVLMWVLVVHMYMHAHTKVSISHARSEEDDAWPHSTTRQQHQRSSQAMKRR